MQGNCNPNCFSRKKTRQIKTENSILIKKRKYNRKLGFREMAMSPRAATHPSCPRPSVAAVRQIYENYKPITEWRKDDESNTLLIYLPGSIDPCIFFLFFLTTNLISFIRY